MKDAQETKARLSRSSEPAAAERIDLNLLNVFDVVMTERHVTRAAERLEMTQSAVSNSLNRLRTQFKDQLFVKTPKGVMPTPRALAMWPRVHQAMEELHAATHMDDMDVTEADLRFRISLGDLSVSLLAPHLYRVLASHSAHTRVFFVPHDPAMAGARLMRGEVDFAIGLEPPRAAVVQGMPLWQTSYVVAGRRGHPLFERPISLASFCECPQLAVNVLGEDDAPSAVDDALANRGLKRDVRFSVNQFSVAAPLLRESDLIAVLPARLALTYAARGVIDTRPLPFSIPDAVLYLTWHQRSNTLPSHQWLKQRLIEAATQLNIEAERQLREG